MKQMIQLGAHPDAESLTAFAEQLLSGAEREQILAHMAACSRCREVVFFTQQMMEPEKLASVTAPQESLRPSPRGWFSGWRWVWVPVGALAGFVGFAVVQHLRSGDISQPQMAQNVAPPETIRNATPAKTLAPPQVHQQAPRREEEKRMSAVRGRTDRGTEVTSTALDQKDKVAQKEDKLTREADSLSAVGPRASGGAVHEMVTARAKSSAASGPMAQNQIQQQNNAQLQEQNYASDVSSVGTLSDSANKPVPASVPLSGASETVAVQAEGISPPASRSPAAAPEIAPVPMSSQSLALSSGKLANLKKAKSTLPSELGVLSQATAAKTTIAIDTAGSLFFSEDEGKHWQPVNARWTGRAVLVRTRPAEAVTERRSRQHVAQFELTTDKLQTWASEDGKTWTLEKPAGR
jgi:hypothetical protein